MVKKTNPNPNPETISTDSDVTATTVPIDAPVDVAPASPLLLDIPSETPGPLPEPARRSGFVAPVIGGALAAVLGFGLSHYDALGLRAPSDTTALAATAARQTADITALQGALAATEAKLSDRMTKIETALSALPAPTDAADLTQRLTALEDRLAAIEALPASGNASSPAIQAAIRDLETRVAGLADTAALPDQLSQKVDSALKRLSDADAEASAKADAATVAVETARRTVALDQLAAAIDRGEPFEATLADLGADALPAALSHNAATGVATRAALAESFPEAARAALVKARASSGEDGWGARLTDFLKAQTGARPLVAMDGTDPEAILSRADAAVRAGKMAEALKEIEALPPEVSAELAGWVAQARARADVEASVALLRSQPLGE